jgi:hypothetical protein
VTERKRTKEKEKKDRKNCKWKKLWDDKKFSIISP